MPEVKSVLVVREPNQQLHPSFKQKLLDNYSTALGYASPQDEDHVDWQIFDGGEVDLAEALEEVEKTYATDRVFYHLVHAPDGGINLDSCQPFPLLQGKQKNREEDAPTLLVAMLTGEFPLFSELDEENQGFSPEFFFMDRFLQGLVNELWELASEDMKMLLTYLEKKAQQDKIKANLGPKANVLLIPYLNGKAIAFAEENKDAGRWQWGFSTNSLGVPAEKTEEKTEQKPKSKLTLKKAGTPAKEETKEEEEEKHPPGGTEVSAEEKYAPCLKDIGKRFLVKDGALWVRPPVGQSWKETRNWYGQHYLGERPGKGAKEEAQIAYAGFPFEKLKPESSIRDLFSKLMGQEKPPKPKEADTEQADPPQKEAPPKEAPKEFTLFIPKEQKEEFLKLDKEGLLDTVDEAFLKDIVAKYPPASAQLGEKDFNRILMLSPAGLARIGHRKVHMLICLANEMRCRLLGLYEDKKEEKAKETVPEAPAAKPKLTLKRAG